MFAGDAVKSVSVTEGESVTLEIDDTTDNEIQWRFGHNILIALVNRERAERKQLMMMLLVGDSETDWS